MTEDREAGIAALERLREAIAGDRRDWDRVLVRPDDIAALLAHKVRDAIPAEPKHRGAPGGVHNHGTEDGPGVACREFLIGACRADAIPAEPPPYLLDPLDIAEFDERTANWNPVFRALIRDHLVRPSAIPAEPCSDCGHGAHGHDLCGSPLPEINRRMCLCRTDATAIPAEPPVIADASIDDVIAAIQHAEAVASACGVYLTHERLEKVRAAIGNAIPAEPLDVERLRAAATQLVRAQDAYIDALNGKGHDGEPHDKALHHNNQMTGSGIEVFDAVADCASCGGAQYGTEDDIQQAVVDVKVALGEPLRPYEVSRAALSDTTLPGARSKTVRGVQIIPAETHHFDPFCRECVKSMRRTVAPGYGLHAEPLDVDRMRQAFAEAFAYSDHEQCRVNGSEAEADCAMAVLVENGYIPRLPDTTQPEEPALRPDPEPEG